jgi:hypothetical protein
MSLLDVSRSKSRPFSSLLSTSLRLARFTSTTTSVAAMREFPGVEQHVVSPSKRAMSKAAGSPVNSDSYWRAVGKYWQDDTVEQAFADDELLLNSTDIRRLRHAARSFRA